MAAPSSHLAGAPALNTWFKNNNISLASSSSSRPHPSGITNDAFFAEDKSKHKQLFDAKPWLKDVHYVRRCYISAIAVMKLILHAQTGRVVKGGGGGAAASASSSSATASSASRDEWVEVMGQLQGHCHDNCVVLTDSFGLPVPATAVECSLDDAATNYLVQYSEMTDRVGKPSKVFGWYHTHPGYTSFLSGTDVNTQRLQQMMGGPIVALVFDPVKTLASGKIELKAFRTYPESYTNGSAQPTPADLAARAEIEKECLYASQVLGEADPSIGLIGDGLVTPESAKKRDVAFFAKNYYEVPITIFRSEKDAEMLDQLWRRYWSKTFSSSPHVDNRTFITRELGAITTHLSGGAFALPSAIAQHQQLMANGGGANDDAGNSNTKGKKDAAGDGGGDKNKNSTNISRNVPATNGKRRAGGDFVGHSSSSRGGGRGGGDEYEENFVPWDDGSLAKVKGLSRNMGIDAIQGLLTSQMKKNIFGH